MRKIHLKSFILAICVIVLFSLVVGEAFARGKSFGGFSSSRSSFSGGSSKKSAFGWGSSKSTKSGLSSTRRKSSAGKMSSADRTSYNRAKSSGTVFNSRSDALKSFKSKNASKYPTTFTTKPNVRPGYIPPTVTSNGKKHNVSYRNGGYGYYAGSVWRPYSPFTDPLMAASLMSMGGYYYGPRPGLSFMAILGMGMTLFFLVTVLKSFAAAAGQGRGKFNPLH
jgi:hypothetical protein